MSYADAVGYNIKEAKPLLRSSEEVVLLADLSELFRDFNLGSVDFGHVLQTMPCYPDQPACMNWSVGTMSEVHSSVKVDAAPPEPKSPPRKLSYADAVGYEFIERNRFAFNVSII